MDTRSGGAGCVRNGNQMNQSIFYIIGVIVVIVAILKFVGVW